jgi:pyrimidine operon attenuation protein/uracil phosphoribosyltransferase
LKKDLPVANKTLVLNSKQIEQKVNRIAYEIYEKNFEEKELIIAGIAPNGFLLSEKIAAFLKSISPIKIKLVKITINKDNPIEEKVKFELSEKDFKDKVVILIDDVLNSGKTLIYGAKHFLKTPVKRLSTVVLVDRNHTRYPVKADFTGISLSTTLQEHISVKLIKGQEAVYLQ